MEMDKKNIKTILKIALSLILFVFVLNHLKEVFSVAGKVIGVLSPLIVGAVMAFIMNIPMTGFEEFVFKKIKNQKLKRGLSILCAFLSVFLIIVLVMGLVIPELALTVQTIIREIPKRMLQMQEWFEQLLNGNANLEQYVDTFWRNIETYLLQVLNELDLSSSSGIFAKMSGAIFGTVTAVVNFFMGLIFAIYILLAKEKLKCQAKRLLKVSCKQKVYESVIEIATLCNDTFQKFITGQCLEAVILGGIFFACMLIMRMPYALTISVLIMLMSLIPVFGSFIGCAAGVFLIVFVNPLQALIFIVMFLVIQQIEGNLIYPHVVGNSVGLPSIWVFVAVILGGNLFGIVGILLFIPICSVLYTLLKRWVYEKEQKEDIKTVREK